MARVTVTPETFHLVAFDAGRIAAIATALADECGLPTDTEVRVEVDETTPFGRTRLLSLDPVTVGVESGGFENPKRPKQMSERAVTETLGRVLFCASDRLGGGFADAPEEEALSNQQRAAWNAYAVGRLARLGHAVAKPRRQYHFRNRHGFNDVSDAVFERLWNAEGLTWADIEAACAETARARELAST